jgi:formylglycine-generating enzyme required for sulfatase activity
MTNCGAGGNGSESCCTSLPVTGGSFFRTYTNQGSGPNGTADTATVANFSLDKYLVTVARFRQFVAAWKGGWVPSAGDGKHAYLPGGGLANGAGGYESGWDATWNSTTGVDPTDTNLACLHDGEGPSATWTPSCGAHENLPINCMSWYEAYAFCIWDGGFLPTEAEWEYAAAGGGLQREYPWGSAAPTTACPGPSCYAIYNCNYSGGSCTDVASIAPVGTAAAGAGLYGQLDLVGDVWEWTLDWYGSPYFNPCTNCASLAPASSRVMRGGGYLNYVSYLLPTTRDQSPPSSRERIVGFRCARAL